ncbi:hypothetical protein GE300_20890 [Rhodobacteraceae bacterium 2CG4]|uniref:Uncharacterized protein n=1 Tax=Halovulum marinum TaxID=2662447 RepID=A0A6L5Z7K2_9RHOB|nr:hypothetical protein [Halovulum marinum]MSU92015.1 hypothetical protein [Halovulum marinum]
MYDKLARGYASQYLRRLPDHKQVDRFGASQKRKDAVYCFAECALSKKPGRTLKRMAPRVGPLFRHGHVVYWDKTGKCFSAQAITCAKDTVVSPAGRADESLYEEKSAFLTDFVISIDSDDGQSYLATYANMGHHAIARFLERDLATPETIGRATRTTLNIVRNLSLAVDQSPRHWGSYSFLIPFGEGGLPAVSMAAAVAPGQPQRHIISVRTYLDENMLSEADMQRMEGFEDAMSRLDEPGGRDRMNDWIAKNIRPWDLRAKAGSEAPGMDCS